MSICSGSRPCAAASACRTMRACASAGGLPRVPSRRMGAEDCVTGPHNASRCTMLVLGIETTCDETAAAVVERGGDGPGKILSNVVLSQIAEHAAFGGVLGDLRQ